MAAKGGCPSIIAAVVLIVVNIIVVVVCLLLLTLGIWTMASPDTLSAVIQTLPYSVVKALLPPPVVTSHQGVAVTVSAAVICGIAAMGLRGAGTRSPFLLFMYAALVFLLLLLEYALFYYFASNLVEKGLQNQDGQWTHALRLVFTCCEFNSSSSPEVSRPWSCCGVDGFPDSCTLLNSYNKDCRQAISSWLDRYQTTVYVSLAVFHILLSFCSLLRRRSPSLSYS